MQRRSTLPFLLCLALVMTGLMAAGQYTFVPRDLPQLYYQLEWNSAQQGWDSTYRYTCDYDVNGRLLRKEQHYLSAPGVWAKFLLTEYAYGFQPDSTTVSESYWDGASWVRSNRVISIQDSLGRLTQDLRYQGSTAWVLQSGLRITYLPGLNGQLEDALTEDYNLQTTQRDTSQSAHYIYGTGGTPDTVLYDFYSNGSWYPDFRDIDIQWQNFSRLKAKYYVRQFWTNNQYVNGERTTCAFGPYEYRRCTTDTWDSNLWVPETREKHLQDASGHLTDTGTELYDGPGWVIGGWIHYDHTYAGGKLAESLVRYWNLNTQQLVPASKYVFVDHAVEVAPPALASPLIAFPVPASDHLYVRADLRGPLRLRVYDLQGRLLQTQDSDAERLQASGIDISQVPDGLYLLHIEAARSHHNIRIQVQH